MKARSGPWLTSQRLGISGGAQSYDHCSETTIICQGKTRILGDDPAPEPIFLKVNQELLTARCLLTAMDPGDPRWRAQHNHWISCSHPSMPLKAEYLGERWAQCFHGETLESVKQISNINRLQYDFVCMIWVRQFVMFVWFGLLLSLYHSIVLI